MVYKSEICSEVVISGIGGLFPRSQNLDEFKELLLQNVLIQDPARWKAGQLDVCDTTSNVPGIDCFDASFFGIHRQQCTYMDPMQRMILESTFEALVDAGVNPSEIRGKKIGVYMGSSISENDSLMFESVENGFGITGQARTMLANRISYWLNITGPSCSFDSSWTNGIQVIQFALDAIKSGQCDAAIVGTTNLTLNIYPTWLFKQQGVTSMDGLTKAFDANADGYSRGEAIITLYLQRADMAKRNYATVVHADVQFNGFRSGNLTDITVDGMTRFLSEFYDKCGFDPRNVPYVEAYGAGIKKVDEVELAAIDNVFCKNRDKPLNIGCIKTNSGHAEASAATMGIIKVLVSMETGTIPATLNYKTPNPNIKSLIEGRIEVVDKNAPWEGEYAAVNAVGLASSLGHILLKMNPKRVEHTQTELPLLRLVSTRTEEGIKEILKILKSEDPVDMERTRLIHDVFSNNISGHLYRGYELHGDKFKEEFEHYAGSKQQIWYIYSGMGSQWQTMGKELLAIPIFADAVEKCHNILKDKGLDVKHIITTDDPHIFDNILHSFVGIAAVQIGLTDILKAIGIVPDGMIGHSVGELGCAYADGCLTAEQMILSAYYRGRASIEVDLIKGMMAAVGMGAQQVKKILPPQIDVACHNGPDSSTLSGPTDEMEKIVKTLQDKGVFAKLVNVSNIAYHSQYIKPAAPLLLRYLKELIKKPIARSNKWISTSVQEANWGSEVAKTVSAEYLTNNLLSSVYFEEGCRHIPAGAIAIEIAPHGLLQAILRRSLPSQCINIPLTKRGSQSVEFLMTALGKMYLSGLELNLAPLYPPVSYPVSRGTKSLSPLIRWEHSEKWRTGLEEFKDYSFTEKNYLITMNSEEFRDLVGHQINEKIVIPAAAYLMLVVDVLSNVKRVENAIFENVFIKQNIQIEQKGSIAITVMVQRGSGDFEISKGNEVVALGRISVPENFSKEILPCPPFEDDVKGVKINENDFYTELYHRGYEFSGLFKSVRDITVYDEGTSAKISWENSWPAFITSMIHLQILKMGETNQNLLMPVSIRRIAVNFDKQDGKKLIDVVYNKATGLISTDGVQIAGVRLRPFPIENKKIMINNHKFVPHINNNIQDMQSGINLCLDIVMQNVRNDTGRVQVTELKDKFYGSLETYVRMYFEQHSQLQFNMTVFDDIKDRSNISYSPLIILNGDIIKDTYTILKQHAEFVLVCISETESLSLNYPISHIASFNCSGSQYHLLKKVLNITPTIVELNTDSLSNKDLTESAVTWVNKVKSALNTIKNSPDKRVYLVSLVLPTEDFDVFISKVKSLPDMQNVRFVFICDKNAPKCTPDEKFYQHIYQSDLVVNVLKNSEWGLFANINYLLETIQEKNHHDKMKDIIMKNMSVPRCNIKYLGVDFCDFSPKEEENKLEYIEYSGVTDSGKRVMGIAQVDLENLKIIPDETLQWPVPENWSLIDAATVSYVYTMAYHVLVEMAQITPSETIFIHDGCSSFGQAAICVAHHIGCMIYTTVGSNRQRAFLKSRYAQIQDHQIMDYGDSSFEKQLLTQTNGVGVQVILNCFSGERLQATIRCLSRLGRIIHFRLNNINENEYIGLGLFLFCTCMTAITPKMIFDKPKDVKKRLHSLVMDGLNGYVVRPIERKIFDDCDAGKIKKYLQSDICNGTAVIPVADSDRIKTVKTSGFRCNKNVTFVIYGDSTESWIRISEWLIFHEAKKIFIVSKTPLILNRRLSLLKDYYNVAINFSTSKTTSPREISEYLSSVLKSGELSAVFAFPTSKDDKENINVVSNIDAALNMIRSDANLVCFWGMRPDIRYKSNYESSNICNVRWENTRKFKDVLMILERIMESGGDVLLRNEKLVKQEKVISHEDFALLLPQNLKSLRKISNDMPNEVELVQLCSSCPRVVREIPPVFVVPGLTGMHCDVFRSFVLRLMYPVHCVNMNYSNLKMDEQAALIIKGMKKITSSGPYNLIGVSWGGALTLEIARQLEEAGEQTQLFFIDAVPDAIQTMVNFQGKHGNIEINLLTELLKIKETKNMNQLLALPNWNSRLKEALNMAEVPKKEFEQVQNAVKLVKHQIDQICNYQFKGKMINGPTKLFRPENCSKDDSCGLTKYCKQVEIKIVTGNHITMMGDQSLIDDINNNVMIAN